MERKINAKTATSKTAAQIAALGRKEKTPLFHIMGRCNGTKLSDGDYGESIGLRGSFEAINAETGEVKTAPIFWPPKFLAEMVNAELTAGGQGTIVSFAHTIGVEPDAEGSMGYQYYIDSLVEPEKSADPFAEMREALPAPTAKAVEDKSKGKGKAKE